MLQELFHGKGYIDGITIINLEGEILFTAKFNDKLGRDSSPEEMVGENFFDIYENLEPGTSTTIKAMECGVPVYVEHQRLKTSGKGENCISSLSIPIKWGGRIVGAIDLSREEREEEHLDVEPISLTVPYLSVDHTQKLTNRETAMFTLDDIIAEDPAMKRVKDYIPVVANCDLPVLICGETGTGKEVVAQAIHNASARSSKPFVAQNCAAMPETLLESILFGTSKGAFTGAVENKGLFELADGGTLFLDEINSMPIQLQSKLLRVLQDGCFRSLGSRYVKSVNVKVIAAINVDPQEAIRTGHLRQDIYYRLSMMSIQLPPLRERRRDIQAFIKLYINKHNATFRKKIRYVSRDLIEKMETYDWPGNLRELEHMIVYGMSRVNHDDSVLHLRDVREKFEERAGEKPLEGQREQTALPGAEHLPDGPYSLRQAVQEYERRLICAALEEANGNIAKAARRLDIPRQTLSRRIQEYEIHLKP